MFDDLRASFEGRAITMLAPTPVVADNVAYLSLSKGNDPFITLAVYWDEVRQIELGMPENYRISGLLSLAIHVRYGVGSVGRNNLLDAVVQSFQQKDVGGAVFGNALPSRPQQREGWEITVVQFPFYFDHRAEV